MYEMRDLEAKAAAGLPLDIMERAFMDGYRAEECKIEEIEQEIKIRHGLREMGYVVIDLYRREHEIWMTAVDANGNHITITLGTRWS